MTAMTNVLMGLFLGTLLTAIAGFLLLARGYKLTPKSLKFPFAEFEASRLMDLSPIKMFMSLSRVAISPAPAALNLIRAGRISPSPLLMIHLAWHVVSQAYVAKYLAYPTEADVRTRVAELGVQNVDFIVLFERVHSVCIRDEEAVSAELAEEYFVRAPSLAERIAGTGPYQPDELYLLAFSFLSTH